MNAKTLPGAKASGSPWVARTFTPLPALLALLAALAGPAAFGQADTFTLGSTLVDLSQAKGNETDPSIAIDSLNPSNMVVAAATDGAVPGLFLAFTTNLGASWTTNFIATNNDSQGLIAAYGEPSVAWDSYGNLFLAYLPNTFEGVAVAASTNGGRTFVSLTNLAPLDATDQPRITAPPLGAAAGSAWIVYKDYTTLTPSTPLQVQGLLSAGLGAFGTFTPVQSVSGSSNGVFADIAVGPLGEVMVTFQDNPQGSPNPANHPVANIWVSLKTNSVSGGSINTNTLFGPAKAVALNALGGVTYLAAAPTGIGVNAAPGLGWDYDVHESNYDKVYLVYTAWGPNGNAIIDLTFSTNSGAKWNGPPLQVDDDSSGSNDHFLPRLAVDPTSGLVGCTWYDCRNDTSSVSAPVTNLYTNVISLNSYTVTNLSFMNAPGLAVISETNTVSGANVTVAIAVNDMYGTAVTALPVISDGTNGMPDATNYDVLVGLTNNPNITITLEGTNTNSTTMTVYITNVFPRGYTSGSAGNTEAVMYSTVSFNGGVSFLANKQLPPVNQLILSPAQGLASDDVEANNLIEGTVMSDSANGWGHYSGLACYGANFFPVWADNSDVTTNNPDGANDNFDLYMLTAGPGQPGISVPTADLSIWVTNSPNPVLSEGVIVYTVVITNNGPKAPGPVTVTNLLSTNVTLESVVPAVGGTQAEYQTTNGAEVVLSWPTMTVGEVLTSTIRVKATTSSIDTNLATVYSPFIDLLPNNNTNLLAFVVAGQNLAMSATTSQSNLLLGETVVTSVTVTNFGPATNGAIFVTNVYSLNWTNIVIQGPGTNGVVYTPSNSLAIANLGLLPIGQPVTVVFTAAASTSPGLGNNNAFAYQDITVASQDYDTNTAAHLTGDFVYSFSGEDLAISMSASPPNLQVGQTVTYTENVANLGPSSNGVIIVTNTLSTNLGTIAVVQPGANYTISNNVVVVNLGTLLSGQSNVITLTAVPNSAGSGANTATVSSQDFDTNLANNTAKATVTIIPALPMISNLVVTALSSSAFIVWDTGSPATAQVEYGVTSNYGSFSPASAAPSTHHVVLLTGLAAGSNYDFEVLSWVGSQLYTTNGSFGITNTLILDYSDASYSGNWTRSSVATGIYSNYYDFTTTVNFNPTAWAVYDPAIPASGLYNVFIWYPYNTTFTTNAQIYVTGSTNALIDSVNETVNGGSWQPLATNMYFVRGTNGTVILYNDTGDTNKYLVADAMMWAYVAAQDYPTNGSVPAWWANFYFGTNVNGNVNGSSNTNATGYSIYDDYVLGLNPTNGASGFSFTVAPASGNEVSITFSPWQGGRNYQLQAATNLASTVWTTLTNGFTVNTNGSATFTVPQTNASGAFYRLSAQITP